MRAAEPIAGCPDETLQQGAMASAPPASEVDAPQRASLPIWLAAAVGAVLIHAACVALAFEYLRSGEVSEELGAPAIEIGIELMAPRPESNALPPGPEAEASAASPAVMEQRGYRADRAAESAADRDRGPGPRSRSGRGEQAQGR